MVAPLCGDPRQLNYFKREVRAVLSRGRLSDVFLVLGVIGLLCCIAIVFIFYCYCRELYCCFDVLYCHCCTLHYCITVFMYCAAVMMFGIAVILFLLLLTCIVSSLYCILILLSCIVLLFLVFYYCHVLY